MRLKSLLAAGAMAVTFFRTPALSAQNPMPDIRVPDARSFTSLRMRGGYLGVGITDVDADRVSRLKLTEERGVEVSNLEEGGPADNAGIKSGDVILTYNGENVLGAEQFVRLVRETPASRKVRLSIWRNGKAQSIVVTTASPRPIVQAHGMEDAFNGFTLPDVHGFAMPYVPKIIMIWDTPSIGLECEPVDTQLAQFFGVSQGVLVRSVGKGSAADRAGFRAGDVLTSASNHPIKTTDDFRRVLRGSARQVPVALVRDHKELTLTLAPLPERED